MQNTNQARALHLRCIHWHLLPFSLFSKIPCLLQRQQLPRNIKSSYHDVVLPADASKPLTGVSAQCNLIFCTNPARKDQSQNQGNTSHRHTQQRKSNHLHVFHRQHHLAFDSIGVTEGPAYYRRFCASSRYPSISVN